MLKSPVYRYPFLFDALESRFWNSVIYHVLVNKGIVETILKDQYSGEGWRQTNAYTSKISHSSLLARRKQFYDAQMSVNSPVWYLISEAIQSDKNKTEGILKAGKLYPTTSKPSYPTTTLLQTTSPLPPSSPSPLPPSPTNLLI